MTLLPSESSEGLSTDQAPPLSIPVSFFLTAPLFVVVAGFFLIVQNTAFASRLMPGAMGVAHLGTLGFLGSVMLGALYQMTPVVAGIPVPGVRLAHGVHVGLVVGVSLLVHSFTTGHGSSFHLSAGCLGGVFLLFILPIATALLRAPTRSDTVTGLRIAVLGLIVVVAAGVLLALGRSGITLPGLWMTWLATHISVGLLGWIGCLIVAVSWQVIPMFCLTAELPRWSRKLTLGSAAVGIVGAVTVALVGLSPRWVALAFTPLALMIWLLHPILAGYALFNRRRKRVDGSIRFWSTGLALAPLLLPVAGFVVFGLHPRWTLLFGWVALWGWAGLIVHGMLTRIIAFLIWFHRFAPLVGYVPVPPMRRIYPDGMIRIELALHLWTLALGVIAIVTSSSVMTVLTGIGMIAAGSALFGSLLRALSHRAPAVRPPVVEADPGGAASGA